MTLNEIRDDNKLSVRAYNVCRFNNLYNLNLILDYYSKKYTFKNLRNCGEGTNKELIKFCKGNLSEKHIQPNSSKKEIKNPYLTVLDQLSRKQREVINSFILVNIDSLSIRSQNAIRINLRRNFKIKNFIQSFLSKSFDVGLMKNVGKKSIPEIEVFIQIVSEFIDKVNQTKDEELLTILRNRYLIQKAFSLYNIPNEVLVSESIFRLASFLLDNNALFDEKETIIVKKSLNVYDDFEQLTLDEIAKQIGLSRERIRQVRKICIEELSTKFNFLKNFNEDLFSNYGIDSSSNYIFIDDELKHKINKLNETNFSNVFLAHITFIYSHQEFDLVGNIKDVLQTNNLNHRNRHNWKLFYLVAREISKAFNFEQLLNDISLRLEERIKETYTFNFKSYLSKFLTDGQIEILDEITPIAEKIIFEELNLTIDLKDNISFKKNTVKVAYEYALEALEHIGKPSKVKKILAVVNELHPDYETDGPKMRVSMKRKHGFVPVGRKSIFGLKKWEKELENFKGGTIRTISKEFLTDFNEPQDTEKLTEYVKQFRPKTNAKSIYNNLYVDESNTFVFFENYYIGLTSKEYSEHFKLLSKKELPEKRTWEESFEILKNFIDENNRLPFSSGCPESEEKLYRWFNVQKSNINKNKLNHQQEYLITSIAKQFKDSLGKRRTNNDERFLELLKFVENNSRLPSNIKNGEQTLYAFHYKQRKKFKESLLNEEDEKKLIEVALLLQKLKI